MALAGDMTVEIHIADDIFVRQMSLPLAGLAVNQHMHDYDHITMLANGAIDAWIDGVYRGTYRAPTGFIVKAGTVHHFESIEDHTVLYCIHNMTHAGTLKDEG